MNELDLPDRLGDYDRIQVPEDVPLEEFGRNVRRAEIWSIIQRTGSPSAVSQRRVADRYSVSPSTKSRDFDRIAEYVELTAGRNILVRGWAAYERAVDELLAEGNVRGAWKITSECL